MNLREALREASERLQGVSDSAQLDSTVLLLHVLDRSRAWFFAHSEDPLGPEQQQAFNQLVDRRLAGEPVAYIVGYREFWSMEMSVNPDVLIPRPETELLVQLAIDVIPADAKWRVADLGTGSGAVAIAVASERPDCSVLAIDISTRALAVAKHNAARHAIKNIRFQCSSWLDHIDEKFNVILSNPPYVAEGDPHLVSGDCRFEPGIALLSGADGLSDIRLIISQARERLVQDGVLALEHGYDQAATVRQLMEQGGFGQVRSHEDLEGHCRVTSGARL